MKKIAFSDKYGLTKAVIEGRKTMTRRIIPDIENDLIRYGRVKLPIKGFEHGVLYMDTSSILPDCYSSSAPNKYQPRYKIGEVVAVAQRYKDAINPLDWVNIKIYKDSPGWTNKMFTCADLMPHRIRITDIKLERIQDISDEDIIREGILQSADGFDMFTFDGWVKRCKDKMFPVQIYAENPRDAFAHLIDCISGRGTWELNPYVYAYSFELVNKKQMEA